MNPSLKHLVNSAAERIATRALATLCPAAPADQLEWTAVIGILTAASTHCPSDLHTAIVKDQSVARRVLAIMKPSLMSVWPETFSTMCLLFAQRVSVELLSAEQQLRVLLTCDCPSIAMKVLQGLVRRLTDVSRLALYDVKHSCGNSRVKSIEDSGAIAQVASVVARNWENTEQKPKHSKKVPKEERAQPSQAAQQAIQPTQPPQQSQSSQLSQPTQPCQPPQSAQLAQPTQSALFRMPSQSPFPNMVFVPRPAAGNPGNPVFTSR